LPEPVLAIPTTSRPCSAGAHDAAWIGDGLGKPDLTISAMTDGGSLRAIAEGCGELKSLRRHPEDAVR